MNELSAYETARLHNMAANASVLDQLGLNGAPATRSTPVKATSRSRESKPRAEPERRSLRVQQMPAPKPLPLPADDDEGEDTKEPPRPRKRAATDSASSASRKAEPAPVDPRSSRALIADLVYLEALVGNTIPAVGGQVKGAVMYAATGQTAWPTFNRMSGIQVWLNCIMLFVNVGAGDDGSYSNVFRRSGRLWHVAWFAQNTQTLDTPVIRRLMAAGMTAASAAALPAPRLPPAALPLAREQADSADTTVLLFCRPAGSAAYVHCGALALAAVDTAVHPLKFTWALLATPALDAAAGFAAVLAAAKRK